MQNTIVKQLENALGVLKDYPGIEHIIDLTAAQQFTTALANTTIGLVPNFKEINEEKLQQLVREDSSTVDEWINALNELKGVGASKNEDADNYVIFGAVCADLTELENGTGNNELGFGFMNDHTANFNKESGTWEEVYLAIVKHVNEKLLVPALPKVE